MKKLAFTVFALASVSGFGKTLSCVVSDDSNQNRANVAVTIVRGAQVVEPVVTKYNGYDITVDYQTGDRYEPQTILSLNANGMTARTYNVSEKGLYQLAAKGLFLQCYFK